MTRVLEDHQYTLPPYATQPPQQVDVRAAAPPCAVVWTTLPCLSTFLPSIGHVGISDSRGVIHDFSAPYSVSTDNFMCGPPRRVWQLERAHAERFDTAVEEGAREYSARMHNILFDNCHSHVAHTLNLMRYENRQNWNAFTVWLAVWTRGTWVSRKRALYTCLPTALIVAAVALFATLASVLA